MKPGMPNTRVVPDGTAIAGGMDIVGSPIFSKPGRARIAYNYEWSTGGGLERIAGIEPFVAMGVAALPSLVAGPFIGGMITVAAYRDQAH